MSDIDPQIVQPSPVPLTYAVETISSPQGNVIRLRIYTPTGAFFIFLTPKDAIAMGKQISHQGSQAAIGLMLPPSVNGHG
jgi:hypothetical protein